MANLSPAQQAVKDLKTDKSVGGYIKLGSEELLSTSRYYISTQSPAIDVLIGQPGIPSGKITTIFGPEGSSKSTLVYHILAETQRIGGIGVLVDSEQRFTKERARGMGLDPDQLIMIEGATLESAFNSIEKCIDTLRAGDAKDVPVTIAYDSLAGSPTDKRMTADVSDVMIGTAARFVNAELPRLKTKLSRESIAFVIVNQLRSRIAISDPRTRGFELRRKVMGGLHSMIAEWPLLFESSLMLRMEAIGPIGDKESPTGLRVKVSGRKNGLSPYEGYSTEVEIDKLHGIDILASKFAVLEAIGAIEQKGGWYNLKADPKRFRKADFKGVLSTHPELEALITAAPLLWLTDEQPVRPASLERDTDEEE